MNIKDYKILRAMDLYGGGFDQSLAQAATLANAENFDRLKAAFPEVWDCYAELVKRNAANKKAKKAKKG